MKNKFFHSIKISFLYFFANKIRAILTIIGCSIGVIIFILGNALAESLTSSNIEKSKMFDRNSIIVRRTNEIKNFYSIFSNIPENNHNRFIIPEYTITMKSKYKQDKTVYINFTLVGVNESILNGPIINNREADFCSITKIIYGSDFSDSQFPGLIMEKSAYKILFGDINSIGTQLVVNDRTVSIQMPVIGIIQDSPVTIERNLNFNHDILDSSVSETYYDVMIYLPIEEVNKIISQYELPIFESYVISFKDDADVSNSIPVINQQVNDTNVTSFPSLMKTAYTERNEVKKVVNIFSIIVVVVSAIFVMITMVFSLKERISEIGLRRAVGANSLDIINQFVIEGMIICFISEIVAILISVIAYNIIIFIIMNKFFIIITQYLPYQILISSLAISVLQTVLFSIAPITVALKINPVNALMFE